ncbi:MAG TPA: CNNM domain-containing protein [Planctomycetota bacterium]
MSFAPYGMAALIAASAVFSGAEAALFTLGSRPREIIPALARKLLADPIGALTAILLGNLVVNLAYFALAASWARSLAAAGGASSRIEIGVGIAAVGVIVVFGEIMPKVVAHRRPRRSARWLLPPVWLLHAALGPLASRIGRLAVARPAAPPELDSRTADELLANEAAGLLADDERDLLRHLLEFGTLRAGALRRPLGETVRVLGTAPLGEARRQMAAAGVAWAAVVDADGEVRGCLDLTRLPDGATAGEAMRAVPVLPELAPVAQGIPLLRRTGAPFVLLVDEYGNSAGILERGRWADTLLNRLPEQSAGRLPAVLPLGGGRFQLDAALPLHDFRDRFGDPGAADVRVDTVGGLVQERLGRVPKVGDRVHVGGFYDGFDLVVTRVDGARVHELELRQLPGNDGTPYTHPAAGTE